MDSSVIELYVGLNDDDKNILELTFSPGLWRDCGWYVKDAENDDELELFAIFLEEEAGDLMALLAQHPCILRAELNSDHSGAGEYTSSLTITPALGYPLGSIVSKAKMAVDSVYEEVVDGFDVSFSEGYVQALEESLRDCPRPPLAVDSVVTSARGRERETSHWAPQPPLAGVYR